MDDHIRLSRSEAAPALLRLHRALSRLGSVLTVMNTGAHPDDEDSGLLAWLRFGQGMRTVVACSTRGEGGQNILGPERGALLGLLRTREMEEAARVLDCDIAWLGFGPDDPVHDFGFSKDGDATFARWGEARIIARLAEAYRRWRPDVVIPTFLDVPGQHGHHRAMTRAAQAALALAAQAAPDAAFPAWQVSRFYLPAKSGAGGTYDDIEPPPPATLIIRSSGVEPATGASYAEIGEWSRRRHASQGMGRWSAEPAGEWRLHLVGGPAEECLAEGLPRDLADLAALAGPAGAALRETAAAIADAQARFPDARACRDALIRARRALEEAEARALPDFGLPHGHRLARKRREIDAALIETVGLRLFAEAIPRRIGPGRSGSLAVTAVGPALPLRLTPVLPDGVSSAPQTLEAPGQQTLLLRAAADAPQSAAFLPFWDALGGNGPAFLQVAADVGGCEVSFSCDLDLPLAICRDIGPVVRPEAVLLTGPDAPEMTVSDAATGLTFDLPEGWQSRMDGACIQLTPPGDAAGGLARILPRLAGEPVLTEAHGSYPHVGPFALARPAVLRFLRFDLALPEGARIAYLPGTEDIAPWLMRMGLDVTVIDRLDPGEDFAAFTTVLIGVVAFGARSDLAPAVPALHRFVERGGNLVTFYQRPDQGWDPVRTPPRPLTVGRPSLRWRVTDPAAPVSILAPDHPVLRGPNAIGPRDFDGWHKERGLYFASAWDAAYQPLLSLADPGEAPLTGALLSGQAGSGRHSHCALVLHHQMEQLVPGAFRLIANLLQPC